MAKAHGWSLRVWVVLVNHYHFVAVSPPDVGAKILRPWLTDFHRDTAAALDEIDAAPGRRVWFQFRDTLPTPQKSYLARHKKPLHHRLAPVA